MLSGCPSKYTQERIDLKIRSIFVDISSFLLKFPTFFLYFVENKLACEQSSIKNVTAWMTLRGNIIFSLPRNSWQMRDYHDIRKRSFMSHNLVCMPKLFTRILSKQSLESYLLGQTNPTTKFEIANSKFSRFVLTNQTKFYQYFLFICYCGFFQKQFDFPRIFTNFLTNLNKFYKSCSVFSFVKNNPIGQKICENAEFLVSKIVVGFGEQDKQQTILNKQ